VNDSARPSTLDFTGLRDLLSAHRCHFGASATHGVAVGLACSGVACFDDHLSLVIGRRRLDKADIDIMLDSLQSLLAVARAQLAARQSEFALHLPNEGVDLETRSQGLFNWCHGFVLGLVASADHAIEGLPEDVREVVRDMMAIANGEPGAEDAETQERALAEIEEYVRVGVQVVYEALNDDAQSMD